MMYDDVVRDFAERTKANLLAINRLKSEGDEVYEVTQLINSMLGLLVFPREEYFERIPQTPVASLKRDGWPIPRVTRGFPQVSHLQQLVRYLRNAIAHFNIKFIGDGQNEIRVLRMWNANPQTGQKTWEAELSLEDLRGIADNFIDLIIESDR